jgi:hypothetical protein
MKMTVPMVQMLQDSRTWNPGQHQGATALDRGHNAPFKDASDCFGGRPEHVIPVCRYAHEVSRGLGGETRVQTHRDIRVMGGLVEPLRKHR